MSHHIFNSSHHPLNLQKKWTPRSFEQPLIPQLIIVCSLCNIMRKKKKLTVGPVIGYYDTIEDRRVLSNVEPGYLKKLLPDGPPELGEAWAEIQSDIESKIMPGLTHWWVQLFCNGFCSKSSNFAPGNPPTFLPSSPPIRPTPASSASSIPLPSHLQISTGFALLRPPSSKPSSSTGSPSSSACPNVSSQLLPPAVGASSRAPHRKLS